MLCFVNFDAAPFPIFLLLVSSILFYFAVSGQVSLLDSRRNLFCSVSFSSISQFALANPIPICHIHIFLLIRVSKMLSSFLVNSFAFFFSSDHLGRRGICFEKETVRACNLFFWRSFTRFCMHTRTHMQGPLRGSKHLTF